MQCEDILIRSALFTFTDRTLCMTMSALHPVPSADIRVNSCIRDNRDDSHVIYLKSQQVGKRVTFTQEGVIH